LSTKPKHRKKTHSSLNEWFALCPRLSNLKGEHAECYKLACFLRAETRHGSFKAVWLHIVNEFAGKERPVWGALLRGLGRLTGAPDYIFMWSGGCGAIEMKTQTGKLSAMQKLVKKWCDDVGVPYVVCRSHQEAVDVLVGWGLVQNGTKAHSHAEQPTG
jgi:hypothetical protein